MKGQCDIVFRIECRSEKKISGLSKKIRKPVLRGPVISFNPRNKRRLPSRASFLRSGQVPGLCVQVEQKHFYSTAEFLPRRRSRVKDIQREKKKTEVKNWLENNVLRNIKLKTNFEILCWWDWIVLKCIFESREEPFSHF